MSQGTTRHRWWTNTPGRPAVHLENRAWLLPDFGVDWQQVVHVAGMTPNGSARTLWPAAVRGIPIGSRTSRIHFLISTGWREPEGTKIGAFVLNFADGQRAELPLLYGEDLRDWWPNGDPSLPSRARVAWTGESPSTRRNGGYYRLYLVTRSNPRPDAEIKSIDFVSNMTKCAPFVIAITVE